MSILPSPSKCAHCATANVIPWVPQGSCQLQGALSLNGSVSICCSCLRALNTLAAQHVRMLTKRKGK